jgi:glycosyltransferase involved in cell wall biosynthesis
VTVLYFADTRFPIERANGVQSMATCHALAARGHDVTLVVRPDSAPRPRDPFTFYGWDPINTMHVRAVAAGGAGPTRRIRYLLAAAHVAMTQRDAVVLTRDLGLAAWLLQLPKATRPMLVYESHGLADTVAAEMPALLGPPAVAPSASKLKRLARREERVWRRAGAYVAITQALATELTHRFGDRPNVFVVPDGARPASGVGQSANTDGRFIAGYAGHLYPWKGVDVFVRAIAQAPGVYGLIVGGHPGERDLERVRALVQSLGIESRVTITGLVAPREVIPQLAGASVLVLPNTASAISERYTSPLKLFEYLTLGRAIVASDLPAVREVLTHGDTAWLVKPGDASDLAAALRALQEDPNQAAALGARAAALAPSFTWEARAVKMERALEAARTS